MNPCDMKRRYFFFGSFALAGCSFREGERARHLVSVARCASYSAELPDLIRRLLLVHRVSVKGQRVVLKPNLVEFAPAAPINTNAVFVNAVFEAFQALGAADVRIAEGPGHRRATMDMAEAAGYFHAIPGFEKHFVDLNLDDCHRVFLRQPFSRLHELHLPRTVLDADLLVSLPKMKTHHWTGATLAMKNLFGIVPGGIYGWPKNVLHWAGIDESVADLFLLFPKQFAIVDGIEAMEGNGPILGSRKDLGLIVAGAHPPSVDSTCCRLMGIDPAKISYLRFAAQRTGWKEASVQQIGERLSRGMTDFALPPGLAEIRLAS